MTTPDDVATDALRTLRAATAALPADEERDDGAAGDAERFEAVHEALVAVLADVDRV